MPSLFYIASDTLYTLNDQKLSSISCQAIDQYKKNLQEIKQRKDWKTKGSGAQFMGVMQSQADDDLTNIFPTDMVITPSGHLIYSACLQDGTAIYSKPLAEMQDAEGLILRKNDFSVYDMDYDATHHRLVLSASDAHSYQRHLSVLAVDGNRIQYVTEGECLDANPVFDPQNPDRIVYDSCGLGIDPQGHVAIGPKEICQLDLATGTVDTILSDAQFDYFKPYKDTQGNLYFLKRPYKNKVSPASSLKDLILAPVKIIKAIIGWLDFFTQRYTGESLKTTSGRNPAKSKQKSEEELFVEGNLIKAQQAIEQNIKAGEKYPGMIPASWQLMKMNTNGDVQVVKKGVLSYAIRDDQMIYSNGRFVVHINTDQSEQMLVEARLVSKIIM